MKQFPGRAGRGMLGGTGWFMGWRLAFSTCGRGMAVLLYSLITMMKASDTKLKVRALLEQAEQYLPERRQADLPPLDGYADVPQWHQFENALWKIGEDIRQVVNHATVLRGDPELLDAYHRIAADKRCARGRQSFVLLFCYKPALPWADRLVALLPDRDIDGHVISALYKMKATGFSDNVRSYCESKTTWIRKEAIRYLKFDKDSEPTAAAAGRRP